MDLLIIQCYSHAPARLGAGAFTIGWHDACKRIEKVRAAGILDKSIVCLGHITDETDAPGKKLDVEDLERHVRYIRTTWPEMPGTAFFQSTEHDSTKLREMVKTCDQLSGKLWPENPER